MNPDTDRAVNLQTGVRHDEEEQRKMGIDYDEHQVRQSVVHTRQDTVLVVSFLEQANEKLRGVNLRLNVLILLLAVLVVVSVLE